jgi:hypothetical protein
MIRGVEKAQRYATAWCAGGRQVSREVTDLVKRSSPKEAKKNEEEGKYRYDYNGWKKKEGRKNRKNEMKKMYKHRKM